MLKLTNLIVILSLCYIGALAAPYQELAPKAGYVPVYIREGNTPLSEIHPKLVEAFHEDEQSNELQSENKDVIPKYPPTNKDTEEDNDSEQQEEDNHNSAHSSEEEYSDESILDEVAKEEETTDSDIAEFESDDHANDKIAY